MSVSAMKKFNVLVYSTDVDATVRKLMNLKCVDIRTTPAKEGLAPFDTFSCEQQRTESEHRLADIRRALPVLAKYTKRKGGIRRRVIRIDREAFVREGKSERAWQAVTDTLSAVERVEALQEQRARDETLLQALEPWLAYDAPLNFEGSAQTRLVLGSFPAKTDPHAVSEALNGLGGYRELVGSDADGVYMALTMLRSDWDKTEACLAARGFVPTRFPEVDTTARAAYEAAERRLKQSEVSLLGEEARLRELSARMDDIEILDDLEATTLNVCMQKRKMATTKHCAWLSGWIPTDREERIAKALSAFECAVEVTAPEENEEPPVLLRNNAFSASFEWVIGMYSYPKYGTFDPTFLMSVFYFIIFGLMFADVGYGLLLVLGCFGAIKLLHPKEGMRRMLSMFGWCGVSCAVMGVLFGGWFGNLPTAILNSFVYGADGVAETTPLGRFFSNGLLFNPINASTSFLVLSLAVGEIHLIAGMAVNMVETCKKGKVLEAICSTVPYWILFLGVDLMAPTFVVNMLLTDAADMGAGARETVALLLVIGKNLMFAGLGLIFLLKGVGQKSFLGWLSKGLGGLYALISYASDLLSYSRILALGLVAGVIAQVINMLTGMGASSAVGFVFMLVVMILGHVLNLAINLLGTFVHAARLQYIEFFGKFYEDGGEPFTPALPAENYTEINDGAK